MQAQRVRSSPCAPGPAALTGSAAQAGPESLVALAYGTFEAAKMLEDDSCAHIHSEIP